MGLIVVLTVSSHSRFPRASWAPSITFYKHTPQIWNPNCRIPASQHKGNTHLPCHIWRLLIQQLFSPATRQDLICSLATTDAHHTEKAVIYYLHLLGGSTATFCTNCTHPILQYFKQVQQVWCCTCMTTPEPCDILSRAFKPATYAVHDLPCMQTRKGSTFLTSPSLFLTSQPLQMNIYRKQ